MSFRDRLHSLEDRFEDLKPAQRWMVGIAIFALVAGLGYYFLIEPELEELRSKEQRVAQLQNEIDKISTKAVERKIQKLKSDILHTEESIDRLKTREMSLLAQLKKKDYLFFNPETFSALLDDMLADSYAKNIELDSVTIEDSQKEFLGRLYERKIVHVEGRGPFLNLVRFVRGIEGHNMLLRIDNLLVETNGTVPRFAFDIKLYGAKL